MSVETPERAADSVSQALLPAMIVACLGALALSLWASAAPISPATDKLIESLHECTGVAEHSARLSCYDRALASAHPAKGANAPVLLRQRP